MTPPVDAVLFDMGGTLRYRVQDPEARAKALRKLIEVLEFDGTPEALYALLKERSAEYKAWCTESLREAPEEELWAVWMWPDGDAERIRSMGVELEHLWRATQGRRIPRPDAVRVVDALRERGYALAIVSNTTSREAVPNALREYGLEEYFPVVVLSSTCGHRKPGTTIFELATEQLGVPADRCAYVGDRPSRDVLGAKRSGFALSILIHDELVEEIEPLEDFPTPDHTIQGLTELLGIL